MKLAKEIVASILNRQAGNRLVGVSGDKAFDSLVLAASSKLEPIREALKIAYEAESTQDMWIDLGKALAMLEDDDATIMEVGDGS